MSDSSIIEHQMLLCHQCEVVLVEEVLLLFVEVDPCLVRQPVGHPEILQTSLEIAVLPQPILSSADEDQRILDFVVS